MKTIIKKISLGIGIVIITIVLFFIGYTIKAKTIIKQMTPAKTEVVLESIVSIQDLFVNVFLIKDGDNYIAIDAGNNLNTILEELTKLGINPDQIKAVLLTHTDGDHVASLPIFKNAKVYLSRSEEQLLNGKKSRFLFFGNSIAAKEYSLIDDQQVFNIGNIKIKGILTPGHTPGSMCYQVNDKYLFTGDLISLKEGKIEKFPKFFNVDTETAVKSIGLITNLTEVEYIFTAHYGYTNDYRKAVKDWGRKNL
jgi:hydroxyacylglutathione hydrolase